MFIDLLEKRTLLAAILDLKTGVLTVDGTDGADVISFSTGVTHTGNRLFVTIGGQTSSFKADKVTFISVKAGSGADSVDAANLDVDTKLDGGSGDDTLTGGAGGDRLIAGGGINQLDGAAGDDQLFAGPQHDSLSGGDGNDVLNFARPAIAEDQLSAGSGTDTIDFSESLSAIDVSSGSAGVPSDLETIIGTDFNDTVQYQVGRPVSLLGNDGNDMLVGSGLGDTLDGGKGNDSLISSDGDNDAASVGTNRLYGKSGNDTLVAGARKDNLQGGNGNDHILPDQTTRADDTLSGGAGNDVVDYTHSTVPVTTIVGETPAPAQANDVIHADVETLLGSEFDDRLQTTSSNPLQINAENGDDTIIPNRNTANVTIIGGNGQDTIDYSTSTSAIDVQITGMGIEEVTGSSFDDVITNGTSRPMLIRGKDGDDTLTGGSGDDTLVGGSGHDSMLGVGGNDHFRAKDGESDTIDGGGGAKDFVEDSDTLIAILAELVSNVP